MITIQELNSAFDDLDTTSKKAFEDGRYSLESAGAWSFMIENIISADAPILKEFLTRLIAVDLFLPPAWMRLLCYKLITDKMEDLATLEWAYYDIILFYHEDSELPAALRKKIIAIDPSRDPRQKR
jgi:hypothetical protein